MTAGERTTANTSNRAKASVADAERARKDSFMAAIRETVRLCSERQRST